MEIEHFPTLMIVESVKGQAVTESPMRYYDGNMKKIESMIGWLKKYALTDIKMKEEVVIEKKQQDTMNREKKSLFYHASEIENLKEKILEDQKPGLVLFLQKDDPKNLKLMEVLKLLARASEEYLNVMVYTISDKTKGGPIRKEVKVDKLPVWKSYQNGVTGKSKSKNAHELVWLESFEVEEKKDQMKVARALLDEINEGIDHDVTEVNSDMYFWSSVEAREEDKVFVSYLYNGKSKDIDMSFKVITKDPALADKFKFYAINDPAEHLTQTVGADELPVIQGSFLASAKQDPEDAKPGEYSMWRVDNKAKTAKGKYSYDHLMLELCKHYPSIGRAYAKKMGYASEPEEQETSITSLPHNFRELKTHEDFYDLCLTKKACGIAFLPAITSVSKKH
jgi:hypothetical protein